MDIHAKLAERGALEQISRLKYQSVLSRVCILTLSVAGTQMHLSNSTKASRFAALRRLVLFNCAAVVGFILGTASFTASMFLYPNPTFAWLAGNVVGGLSHFAANWIMQGQSKKEIAKCFIVFNVTGILSFLFATAMFAVAEIYVHDSTASWLSGSVVGTLTHFAMNDRAVKFNFTFRIRRSGDCKDPEQPQTS
jgi:hypothetical protein